MDPNVLKAWQGIFRDVVITILATFMLSYETVFVGNPNAYIIGAGLTLLGIPPALRLDKLRKKPDEDP